MIQELQVPSVSAGSKQGSQEAFLRRCGPRETESGLAIPGSSPELLAAGSRAAGSTSHGYRTHTSTSIAEDAPWTRQRGISW